MPALFLLIPDTALCEAVIEQIKAAGLPDPRLLETPESFAPEAASDAPPVVVIDGAATLAAWQAAHRLAPATLLALGNAPEDEDAVAESFAKPLRLGHLMARLRYHLETAPLLRDKTIPLGPFILEPLARRLIRTTPEGEGEILRLTEKETALLVFLSAQDAPVSRRDILAAVWGYDERIDTHTFETHLYHLRRKLGEAHLVCEAGGYRLAKGAA